IVIIPGLYGWIYSSVPNSASGSISISIVQPNWAPQEYTGEAQKELWGRAAAYIKKAAADSPDVILFPESFGVYFDRQGELLDDLKGLPATDIIIGGVKYDSDRFQTYNSVFQIRPGQGIVSVYDKGALIPLIENAYAARADDAHSFSIAGRRFLPLVCFESLIESRSRDRQGDSQGFLLLANETWFGTRTLPFLHIASLVMRSIEYGQPSAMAGNTISIVSDPRGRFKTTSYRQEEIAGFDLFPQRIETIYSRLNSILPYFAALFAFVPLSLRRARR
ncbi:MAG: nitrilase-related carbon-nitrogen hydrolase, partial [bacterium]